MPETNQLKGELPTYLDNASGGGVSDLACRRATNAVVNGRAATRSTADQRASSDRVLVVVPSIEEVPVDFEVDMLGDAEVLSNAHVPVVDPWLAEPVAGCIAIDTQRGLFKAVEVDPLQDLSEILMNVATLYLVRALEECAESSSKVVCRDAEREPGLECGDSRGLPSADQQIHCTVYVGCDFASATEGQVVNVAGDESLVDIEIGRAVVQLRVVIVHESLEASAGCANAGSRRFVVLAVGPGINHGCGQVVSTVFHLHIHCVVVRVAVPVTVDVDVDKVLVRQPTGIATRSHALIDISPIHLLLTESEAV